MKEYDIDSIEKWSFQADICLLLVVAKSIIMMNWKGIFILTKVL